MTGSRLSALGSQLSALGLPIWLLVLGCESSQEQICNETPGHSSCIAGDAGPGDNNSVGCGTDAGYCLTYWEHRVDGGTTLLGFGGQYASKVAWQMPGGAPANGAVVQKIANDGEGLHAGDGPACSEAVSHDAVYWELFPIAQGEVLTSPAWDAWGNPQQHASGYLITVGEASYYTNAEMGTDLALFKGPGESGSHRGAGTLRSRTTEPGFWSNAPKPRLVRAIHIQWVHCQDQETELLCSYSRNYTDCEL